MGRQGANTPGRAACPFRRVSLSLRDLAGADYADAVLRARAFVSGEALAETDARLSEKVDFYPEAFHGRMVELLARVGQKVAEPLASSASGATTAGFAAATKAFMAPVSAYGLYRVGEDGRLYLVTKSEHYHAPLGHSFPGYRLIENARAAGIPNATHNNTRGHITRLLEEELVRAAAGVAPGDDAALSEVLASRDPKVANRVLNLETGSLAVEAAIKMILARFYRVQSDSPPPTSAQATEGLAGRSFSEGRPPEYEGRVPVIVVIGDDDGGEQANYHGTTMFAQAMRGMWPGLKAALESREIMLVRPVRPNDISGLESVFGEYETPPYKIAGFFHELVLMNYGAKTLTKDFVRRAYALCEAHDVPTVDDEIQSCVWSPDVFLYREYGIRPGFVVVGKGFPGGEYAASRILFTSAADCLPQFGALVTNGQEELASLAYLITMRWARENAEATRAIGERYEARVRELAGGHPGLVKAVEGSRHMTALHFHELDAAKAFAARLNEAGIDISVQTYKSSCPPAALTKLPLTAGYEVVDRVVELMDGALEGLH